MKILKWIGNGLLYFCGVLSALSLADSFVPEQVCKVDPTCRKMTQPETAIAKNVFGKKFDTSKVLIFERPTIYYSLKNLLMGSYTKATARDNAIFVTTFPSLERKLLEWGKQNLPEEFEDYEGLSDRKTLVHELTHVAQHQLKIPFNKNVKAYTYKYKREPGKKFEDYSEEQQAEIAVDYFINLHRFNRWAKGKRSRPAIRSFCSALAQETQIFEPHFKPELPAICQAKVS